MNLPFHWDGRQLCLPEANSLSPPFMDASDLRVAIFSGNFNYVRDGAKMASQRR